MEAATKQISVIEPVGAAIAKVKAVLFSPFDASKWFTIGFCAWLTTLGQGGGSSGIRFPAGEGRPQWQHIRHSIEANLYWIVPLGLFVAIVILLISLVLMWLRSRGKFMFLHCAAVNKAEIAYPWKQYAPQANSLFLFKLTLWAINLVCLIPLIIGMIVICLPIVRREKLIGASIAAIAVMAVFMLFTSVFFGIVHKFTDDFVVPIMYIARRTCTQAWKRFWEILKNNFGKFILYLLFQIVIGLCISIIMLAAFIGTCCCFCCITAIPYIGTVVLLPVLMFKRLYSACYLAQYGPDFDVFAAAPADNNTENLPVQI